VTFWDAGEFITAAWTFGIPHPPGTPLYVALGHVWVLMLGPVVGVARAMNLLSAVATAGAAGVTAWLFAREADGDTGDMRGGMRDGLWYGVAAALSAGLMASAVTPLSPYCHVAYGILTQLRGLSSFVVPRIDVQLAATFQSKPGPLLAASYAVPNSAVVPSLGRNLSGNAMNVTVNLIPPGSLYGDRINQLDLRAGKSLKWGQKRTLFAVDIYNALNSSAILTYNNAFVPGGPWLQPLTILTPRLVRITAELEW